MTRSAVPTVTLTRAQIVWILEHAIGWESIDTRSFWRLAKKENADPGTIEQELRLITGRTSDRIRRAFAKSSTD